MGRNLDIKDNSSVIYCLDMCVIRRYHIFIVNAKHTYISQTNVTPQSVCFSEKNLQSRNGHRDGELSIYLATCSLRISPVSDSRTLRQTTRRGAHVYYGDRDHKARQDHRVVRGCDKKKDQYNRPNQSGKRVPRKSFRGYLDKYMLICRSPLFQKSHNIC